MDHTPEFTWLKNRLASTIETEIEADRDDELPEDQAADQRDQWIALRAQLNQATTFRDLMKVLALVDDEIKLSDWAIDYWMDPNYVDALNRF